MNRKTLSLWVILSQVACAQSGPAQQQDALIGGAVGAIIGSQFGHGEGHLLGAALGAGIGALGGAALGERQDEAQAQRSYAPPPQSATHQSY